MSRAQTKRHNILKTIPGGRGHRRGVASQHDEYPFYTPLSAGRSAMARVADRVLPSTGRAAAGAGVVDAAALAEAELDDDDEDDAVAIATDVEATAAARAARSRPRVMGPLTAGLTVSAIAA